MRHKKVICIVAENKRRIYGENRIWGNHKGQVTVMLSLLLTVILLFLLVCSEGVFLSLSKSRMSRDMVTAGEGVLADYDPFLWEQYHLFAVDQTYGGMGEDAIAVKFEDYFMRQRGACKGIAELYSCSFRQLSVEQPLLYCEDMEILKNQIREYMKYKTVQEGWEQLQSFWNEETVEEMDAAKSDVVQAKQREAEERAEQNAKADASEDNITGSKTESMHQTDAAASSVQSKAEGTLEEDPRDTLHKALKLGIVELVTGRTDLSKESYGLSNLERDMKVTASDEKEISTSFSSADDILERLSISDNVSKWGSELGTESMALSYAALHFPSLCTDNDMLSAEGRTAFMQCQYEYLIGGRDSDYANAKAVINRLVALRFPLNYIYVVKQPEHVAYAQSLAVELVGASLNPAAVEVVAYLLLACESYVEAILDVRVLMHGGRIPLKKTKESWKVSFAGIASMLLEKDGEVQQTGPEDGLDYGEYLGLLLAAMPDKEQKYRRMLCIMDYEGRKQNAGFAMKNMTAGFYIRMELHLDSVFCGGAAGLVQDGYSLNYEKMFSY
ncbi:MAG: hypothetical protein J6D02_06040 [Lachnospira sp.]|nr:hypothetical protein [Lachnospira sp.]